MTNSSIGGCLNNKAVGCNYLHNLVTDWLCIAKKRIPFEVLCTLKKSEVERQTNGEKDVKRIVECISDEGSKKLHVAKFC